MLFSDKNYYYLQEVIERWNISKLDLRYFAEHGELEILSWIPDRIMKVFQPRITEDGQKVMLQTKLIDVRGYVVVDTDELRKIFHASPQNIQRFKSPASDEIYELCDNAPFMISIDDLVVSRIERNRFEELLDLPRNSKPASNDMSFPGRPSVMHKISHELHNRSKLNVTLPTWSQEAKALESWAQLNIHDQQLPTCKAISNALRGEYKSLSTAMRTVDAQNIDA